MIKRALTLLMSTLMIVALPQCIAHGRAFDDANLPALSEAAEQMVAQSDPAPLEQNSAQIQASLEQTAWQLSLQMEFTRDPVASRAAIELSELLANADVSVDAAQADLGAITAYLDAYPHDDWPERFGGTGFYTRIMQLARAERLLRALLTYHSAVITVYHNEPLAIESLEQSRQQLRDMVSESSSYAGGHGRLWLLRITHLLAQHQRECLTEGHEQIESLLETPLPTDLEFEVRFEALRNAAMTKYSTRDTANLRSWITAHRGSITDPAARSLQVTMFQAHHAASTAGAIALYRALAVQYPQLKPDIGRLLVGYHAKTLADDVQLDAASAMNDFELIALKQHYQSCSPPQYYHAGRLCEAFLSTRSADNLNYGDFLYDAGRCRRYLIRGIGDDNDIAAVTYFLRLAREFPHHPQAPQGAAEAAALAYDLFTSNAEQFADLALEALGTLVGQIEPGWTKPVGPFAQTAAARQFRYYYALTLQIARQYAKAAAVFATVGDDSPHQPTAHRQSLLLRAQCQLDADPGDPNACLALLDKLTSTDDPQALQLRAHAHVQLGQIAEAIALLRRGLAEIPQPNAALVSLCLNVLHRQFPVLLDLHARGRHQQLAHLLGESVSLIRIIDSKLPTAISDEITSQTSKTLLELLSLTAITITDHQPIGQLPPLPEIFTQAHEVIETRALLKQHGNSMWLTRVRALLAFVAADYENSQQLWYRIRRATTGDAEDAATRYYWWQARYFGLRCLALQGQPEQAAHIIDVLNHSRPHQSSPWRTRLAEIGTVRTAVHNMR